MHIEVDKMGEKVSSGQYSRVAAAECTMAVLKALSVLEGGYPLPQAGDSSASSSNTGCVSVVICGELIVNFVSSHVLTQKIVCCDRGSSIPHFICICAS